MTHLFFSDEKSILNTRSIEYLGYRVRWGENVTEERTVTARPKREDVRQAIVEAGVKVFEAEGYDKASISRIAAEAGFTKGAVYSNFGSKPELFTAVVTHHLNTERGGIMQVVLNGLDEACSTEVLIENLSLQLARALQDLVPWQIALDQFRSLAQRDKEIAAVYRELSHARIETVVDMCASHPVAKDILTERLEIFATALLSLVNVLCLELAAQISDGRDERRVAMNAEILRSALKGMIR